MRIGTWNFENLFRPEDEDGPSDPAAYGAKLKALAEVIARIQPDVVAVQEVGHPDALADPTPDAPPSGTSPGRWGQLRAHPQITRSGPAPGAPVVRQTPRQRSGPSVADGCP